MKNLILIIITCALISSCGNSIKGKIEEREDGKIYLVNTSTSKEYQFTVRETIIINDTAKQYHTLAIPVIAGGEEFIGIKEVVSPAEYPIIEVVNKRLVEPKFDPSMPFEIVQTDTLDLTRDKEKVENPVPSYVLLHDTVINGYQRKFWYVKEKVKDTLHPLPPQKCKYNYQVTAQVAVIKTNGASIKH